MRFQHYLRTADHLIQTYTFDTPLAIFLRNYFRANRKMGSTDRKTVGNLVYYYFRTKFLLQGRSLPEILKASWFLCHQESSAFLRSLAPDWDFHADSPVEKKIQILGESWGAATAGESGVVPELAFGRLFPFQDHLSAGISADAFARSLLTQPRLFLRLRPEKAADIKQVLHKSGVAFEELTPACLSLDNSTRADQLLKDFTGYFEVQDYSSQQTGTYFRAEAGERWWDACAGSGGKSLLLYALQPAVKLFVSDNRPSILRNLTRRFRTAGISAFEMEELDLTQSAPAWPKASFDGVILDAPCSGSGTWGRSPEMMAAFQERRIASFSRLQETLALNTLPFLKPGSPLVYITCSVFREENEQVIERICRSGRVDLEEQDLLKGYEYQADTMYVARLIKR